MVLFGEVVNPYGIGALLEQVEEWEQILLFYSPVPLLVLSASCVWSQCDQPVSQLLPPCLCNHDGLWPSESVSQNKGPFSLLHQVFVTLTGSLTQGQARVVRSL